MTVSVKLVTASGLHVQSLRPAPGGGHALLVVEFLGVEGGGTLAGDLAGGTAGTGVYRLDPVSGMADSPNRSLPGIPALAADYASALSAVGASAFTVVGYCGGAALTTAIVSELAKLGADVRRCVLLAPGFPRAADVQAEFDTMLAKVECAGGFVLPVGTVTADAVQAAAMTHLDAGLTDLADRLGLERDEAEVFMADLSDRYRAWLGFLLMSASADTSTGLPCRTIEISPLDHVAGGGPERAFVPWPGVATGSDLLADPHLVEYIARITAGT
jgi:pimeloyl-ACP methyl ester carboxylesterase